jgi:hypothetical protein
MTNNPLDRLLALSQTIFFFNLKKGKKCEKRRKKEKKSCTVGEVMLPKRKIEGGTNVEKEMN